MFLPLGSEGRRTLVPAVTIAIVVVNVLIHLVATGFVERSEKREIAALRHLAEAETSIASKHGLPEVDAQAVRAGRADDIERFHESFWERWDRGEIVPRTDAEWQQRAAILSELEAARVSHPHSRFGFRAATPSALALLLSAFLHGDWMHLIGNMLMLWALAAPLEESWGRRLLGLTYALGIVLPPWIGFFAPGGGTIPGIGASAAVSAIAGAFAVRHFTRRLRVFMVLPLPGVYTFHGGWFLLAWFGWQIWEHGHAAGMGGTAYGEHAMGFLVGLGAALAFRVSGSESSVQPVQESLRRRKIRDEHEALASEKLRRGDRNGGLADLRAAIEATPDDAELRIRAAELLVGPAETDEARQHLREAMQSLWRDGRRARHAEVFASAEARHGPLPPEYACRTALALETSSPHEAAALYVRVIKEAPADPAARQAVQLYARLLDRMGEHDKAAQVRALRPRLEEAAARRGGGGGSPA